MQVVWLGELTLIAVQGRPEATCLFFIGLHVREDFLRRLEARWLLANVELLLEDAPTIRLRVWPAARRALITRLVLFRVVLNGIKWLRLHKLLRHCLGHRIDRPELGLRQAKLIELVLGRYVLADDDRCLDRLFLDKIILCVLFAIRSKLLGALRKEHTHLHIARDLIELLELVADTNFSQLFMALIRHLVPRVHFQRQGSFAVRDVPLMQRLAYLLVHLQFMEKLQFVEILTGAIMLFVKRWCLSFIGKVPVV